MLGNLISAAFQDQSICLHETEHFDWVVTLRWSFAFNIPFLAVTFAFTRGRDSHLNKVRGQGQNPGRLAQPQGAHATALQVRLCIPCLDIYINMSNHLGFYKNVWGPCLLLLFRSKHFLMLYFDHAVEIMVAKCLHTTESFAWAIRFAGGLHTVTVNTYIHHEAPFQKWTDCCGLAKLHKKNSTIPFLFLLCTLCIIKNIIG